MQLYSTKNPGKSVTLKEAVLKSLPTDNGLYMPHHIPQLPSQFINNLKKYSFQEIALEISKHLLGDNIPFSDLRTIIEQSITFPAPLVRLEDHCYILELFHGPSLAFKDFGARFMAQLMGYFYKDEVSELTILVATSGDTGGAVAAGFLQTPGIRVVILYPSGKVSSLQEKQLTTLGHNIVAIEIKGTFDDCQALVKKAFLDKTLNDKVNLSSANSINIARLIPQSFYYFEAHKQLEDTNLPVVFSVPSGNFGNLTAGLFAKKMGLPVDKFIAATNANNVVPSYLHSGIYAPRKSIRTLSNAMDVGNPSNFARIQDLFGYTWNIIADEIKGYSFDDSATRIAVKAVFDKYSYVIDPHGAVAYLALNNYQKNHGISQGIILETAHPSKFIEDVENILNKKIIIPDRLASLALKEKKAFLLGISYPEFKEFLLSLDD